MITTSKHTCGGPVFGRLAPAGACPRCDELREGAPPRVWATTRSARLDRQRIRWTQTHDCARSGCGSVCTFGDW